MNMELSFTLSLFNSKTDTRPKEAQRTWTEMCARFERPIIREAKDGALFSPALFRPAYRLQENVTEISLLVLDYDHHASLHTDLTAWRKLKCCFAAYSTHSHMRSTKTNPKAEERFRVVVPLVVPIPMEKFPALWQWAARISGGKIDAQAQDASRMYYTPAIASSDAPYQSVIVDGESLDWRVLDLESNTNTTQSRDSKDETGIFEFHEDRHTELCRRIMARGSLNSRGHYDAQCLAHNGKGKTALAYFPESSAVKCNAGCSYGALLIAEGLPASHMPSKKRTQPSGTTAEPDQWDLPAAFYEYDLPVFPIETLPAWLRAFVQGLARETQTPLDLGALLTLSVCAGAVAGKVRVQPRPGWIEPLNLYTVTAMSPANRKSAVFAACCEPLEERERTLVEDKRDEIAQAESEYRMLEERRNRLEKDAARTDDSVERQGKKEEAIKLAQELATLKVPASPRLIAADVTPERLASMLAEQDGRMCLFSPEGDLFDMLAGRYTGGSPNFDVILKGHSGDALRVDRRGRSEHVRHPALTIGLTVQPDVIRGLVDKPGFRGRGLIGRFLYSIPKSTIGHRLIAPEPLENLVRLTYKANVQALAQLEMALDYDSLPVPRMLYLTADANTLLERFEAELEPQLAEDGGLGTMADWAGKLSGAIVRIVSILHLAEHALQLANWPERVASETMSRAIEIGRFLIPHAKAAYAEMGADAQVENAKHVLRWIERTEQQSFSRRDAHQALKGRFKKVADIEPALELLEAHGYVRARIDVTDRRPGRKPSQVFDVNPFLLSQSHNPHNSQNYPLEGKSEDNENIENESSENFSVQTPLEQPILEELATARERVRI
jgi:replicative DNA helicase